MPRRIARSPASTARGGARAGSGPLNPARISVVPGGTRHLDPTQLAKLEREFRSWSEAASRPDIRASRRRILLIFLLIRYTGARLNEVLALDLRKHIDVPERVVSYGSASSADNCRGRKVQISAELMSEIQAAVDDPVCGAEGGSVLRVDPGHVRRKFYERSVACGFAQDLGSPNAIRRARAVELMQSNMPLPAVQRLLGHSTPNLTASLVEFSDEDIHQVTRHFMERESRRKTSARNTFFGKIRAIRKGDIQSQVELATVGGDAVTTIITNNSLERLGLKRGSLVVAEVKAPWVTVLKAQTRPLCSAENLFLGTVTQVRRGKLTTEFIVRIQDGTELCSLVTEESRRKLNVEKNDRVWVLFNSFAVILHVD
ncbi:MAG: TOBE domain-containing protein [Desulfomonile tiedjei]|nr:TOBE domain-containing protein [Desulfomonile tiedjei]